MMLDCVSRAIAVAWAPVALSSNTLFKKPYSHKNSGKVAIHNIPTLLYLFFNFNVWILTHCTQRDAMGVRGASTLSTISECSITLVCMLPLCYPLQ